MNPQTPRSSDFLRAVLLADAIATGATALALVGLSGPLGEWLNLPAGLLFWVGVVLAPWVAFVASLSRRARTPALDVWTVVVGNALWAVGSVALAFAGGASAPGVGLLLAQALVVAAFAELQVVGLRRTPIAVS